MENQVENVMKQLENSVLLVAQIDEAMANSNASINEVVMSIVIFSKSLKNNYPEVFEGSTRLIELPEVKKYIDLLLSGKAGNTSETLKETLDVLNSGEVN